MAIAISECDFLEGCKSFCCSPVRKGIGTGTGQNTIDHVMAPFITVTLQSGNTQITVGNNSSPPFNHAVIKSFKFGTTLGGGGGGFNMQIEIADEAGNQLFPIFDTLGKSLNFERLSTGSWISVKWGWVGSRCDGTDKIYQTTETHTAQLNKIQCNYRHGLMSYLIEGTDLTTKAFQATANKNHGADNNVMSLKDAIRQLCKKYNTEVKFLRPNSGGSEWHFGQGGQRDGLGNPDFPRGTWRESSLNLVQTIMNWIAPYKTDRGKGVVPAFVSQRQPGGPEVLVLWEDGKQGPGEIFDPCTNSIGTYIVNGGKNSPVLSFNPRFEWTFAENLNESGGSSSQTANQQLPEVGKQGANMGPKGEINRGSTTSNVNTQDAVRNYGTQESAKETRNAQVVNSRANATYHSISAELRLVGDPTLSDPYTLPWHFVSIIVIPPYHLRQDIPQGGRNRRPQSIDIQACGDWLHEEPCNPVLSNRAWHVKGFYHEIKEGSYTTTLQLFLDAPGTDIEVGRPLGNDPSAPTVR